MDDPVALVRARADTLSGERERLVARIQKVDAELADLNTTLRILNQVSTVANKDSGASQGNDRPSQTKTDILLETLEKQYPRGLTQPQIRDLIRKDYGVEINANTATVTLSRLKSQRHLELRDRQWFYVPSNVETAGASTKTDPAANPKPTSTEALMEPP